MYNNNYYAIVGRAESAFVTQEGTQILSSTWLRSARTVVTSSYHAVA